MKSTDAFKQTIKEYLSRRSKEDKLFAMSCAKESKNLDDCITYILNTVQKSGCNGFTEDEIFGMAVHYYDEDEIDIGKPVACSVVVNHKVELTEEEKEKARKDAAEKYQNEVIADMKKKASKPKKKTESVEQPSLFDL